MKNINRRDVLKGMSAISAAGLTAQMACNTQQTPAKPEVVRTAVPAGTLLNIVLHGTYAIVLEHGKTITLKAPTVADHVYYAATADLDATTGEVIWRQISWIVQNSSLAVKIRGSSSGMPIPDPKNLPTDRVMIDWGLSKIKDYDAHNPPYHFLSLPWPDNIYALRGDSRNALTGRTLKDNNVTPKRLPTVYVLAYNFATPSAPVFTNNFGTDETIPVGSDGVMRLHLFAEPPNDSDHSNPNRALGALCRMFRPKLDLTLNVDDYSMVPPDAKTAMPPGVDRCEERSIGELAIPCSKLADYTTAAVEANGGAVLEDVKTAGIVSGHPRNCMAVLINESE